MAWLLGACPTAHLWPLCCWGWYTHVCSGCCSVFLYFGVVRFHCKHLALTHKECSRACKMHFHTSSLTRLRTQFWAFPPPMTHTHLEKLTISLVCGDSGRCDSSNTQGRSSSWGELLLTLRDRLGPTSPPSCGWGSCGCKFELQSQIAMSIFTHLDQCTYRPLCAPQAGSFTSWC